LVQKSFVFAVNSIKPHTTVVVKRITYITENVYPSYLLFYFVPQASHEDLSLHDEVQLFKGKLLHQHDESAQLKAKLREQNDKQILLEEKIKALKLASLENGNIACLIRK
jgi:hypothetical protein